MYLFRVDCSKQLLFLRLLILQYDIHFPNIYIFSSVVPFSARIIDGINRSDPRRRALIFFCFEYFNVTATVSDHHMYLKFWLQCRITVYHTDVFSYIWRVFFLVFEIKTTYCCTTLLLLTLILCILLKDALLLSIDHHGFDVLAKVPEKAVLLDVPRQYVWREFRFSFKEAAKDIEDFCRMLVELEEEALQSMKSYSGL